MWKGVHPSLHFLFVCLSFVCFVCPGQIKDLEELLRLVDGQPR